MKYWTVVGPRGLVAAVVFTSMFGGKIRRVWPLPLWVVWVGPP